VTVVDEPRRGVTAAPAGASRVLRRTTAGWEDVEVRPYTAGPAPATRQLLAGGPGSGCAFELRYFELPPGGRSRREQHHHQHAVVVLRGAGAVDLGGLRHPLGSGDLVHVAAGEPHQFHNTGNEPFGFLCVVDSERDAPVPLGEPDGACCEPPGAGGDGV
jgi:quercetin dioxygenase-like cupin family protein